MENNFPKAGEILKVEDGDRFHNGPTYEDVKLLTDFLPYKGYKRFFTAWAERKNGYLDLVCIDTNEDFGFIRGAAAEENFDPEIWAKVAKEFNLKNPLLFENFEQKNTNKPVKTKVKEFLQKNNKQMSEKRKLSESKFTSLKETPEHSLSTPKPITNYTDSDIERGIKNFFDKESKFVLLKIQSNADKIYNVVVVHEIEDDEYSFELDKYQKLQQLHQFRLKLFTELSKVFPIVNVNLAAWSFVKGDTQIKFALSILLSDTNNKDWVTGNVKKTDQKERNKLLLGESKKNKWFKTRQQIVKKLLKEFITEQNESIPVCFERRMGEQKPFQINGTGKLIEREGIPCIELKGDGINTIIIFYEGEFVDGNSTGHYVYKPCDQNASVLLSKLKAVRKQVVRESNKINKSILKESLNQPDYQFYVCEIVNNSKIVINEGFEYKNDALGRIQEQREEGHTEGLVFKVFSGKFLKSKDIDPNNDKNWGNPSYVKMNENLNEYTETEDDDFEFRNNDKESYYENVGLTKGHVYIFNESWEQKTVEFIEKKNDKYIFETLEHRKRFSLKEYEVKRNIEIPIKKEKTLDEALTNILGNTERVVSRGSLRNLFNDETCSHIINTDSGTTVEGKDGRTYQIYPKGNKSRSLYGTGEVYQEYTIKLVETKLNESPYKVIEEFDVEDAFNAIEIIRKLPGILAVNAITGDKIRVKFNKNKITKEQIVQAINQ